MKRKLISLITHHLPQRSLAMLFFCNQFQLLIYPGIFVKKSSYVSPQRNSWLTDWHSKNQDFASWVAISKHKMPNLVSLLKPKLLYMYLTSIYIHCLHCYSTWRLEMQRNSKKFHSKPEQFLYIFQAMHCESTGSGSCSIVRNDQSDKLIYSAHRFPGSLFDQ